MSLCICALDDDESILYTLEAMAITQNWIFRGTTHVEQCLDWIRDGVVELLLLDYHMPLQNGLDVLRKVQLVSPSLPVSSCVNTIYSIKAFLRSLVVYILQVMMLPSSHWIGTVFVI